MFRRIDEFRTAWQEEARTTMKVLEAIPDEAMGQSVGPEDRDLGRIGWHLVECMIGLPGHLGLRIEGAELLKDGFIVHAPASMPLLRDAYAKAGDSLLKAMESWDDAELEREDDLSGMVWKRGHTLQVLITHQAHHRGQMTVLMRQAGLKVPDVYGPSREGWATYGMTAPRV